MATKKIILCDTNIFIDYFQGNERTIQELDYLGFDRLAISVVTVAEIYFGMRKRETEITRDLVRKFSLMHLDKGISKLFIQYMLGYKHLGMAIPDALIAATTVYSNIELYTHNRQDFEFIENLKLYNPKF